MEWKSEERERKKEKGEGREERGWMMRLEGG